MIVSKANNILAEKEICKIERREFRKNIFYICLVYLILFLVGIFAFSNGMHYFFLELCLVTLIYSIFVFLHLYFRIRFQVKNQHVCRVVQKQSHDQYSDGRGNTYSEPRRGRKDRSYYTVEFKDRDLDGNRITRSLECTKDQYNRIVVGENILVADIYRRKEKEYSVIGVIPII